MHAIQCPACGSAEHYRLKDTRLQCAGCRKKFSARKLRSRLPEETVQRIVQGFGQMVPAAAMAAEQGLNIKTLQKFYDRLRRTLTELNERDARERFGGLTIDPRIFHDSTERRGLAREVEPLFCLAGNRGNIVLLTADGEAREGSAAITLSDIAGWIYAQDHRALGSLDLDRIHFLPSAEGTGGGVAQTFWMHAKRGLITYHGGFRKNFYLFMREMEFRFNTRTKDFTHTLLLGTLQKDELI